MENKKIKIGDYVRTKKGIIDKVIKYDEILEEYWCEKGMVIDINNKIGIHLKDIINHSRDIKYLIAEGDIIEWESKTGWYRGLNEVITRPETDGKLGVYAEEYDSLMFLEDINIQSIVTKEQFNQGSYKVGE